MQYIGFDAFQPKKHVAEKFDVVSNLCIWDKRGSFCYFLTAVDELSPN